MAIMGLSGAVRAELRHAQGGGAPAVSVEVVDDVVLHDQWCAPAEPWSPG